MDDLVLDRDLSKGSRGGKVRLVQEWLCLHAVGLEIDGSFGAATEAAVSAFQRRCGLRLTGVVDQGTFAALTLPMVRALAPLTARRRLGDAVAACARQHLREHPREIGGQNRGPWVRLYMRGNEGAGLPWCAGFACFVLKQACDSAGAAVPFPPSDSTSQLKRNAVDTGLFLSGADAGPALVTPGAFFLQRGGPTGWKHTGLVIETEEGGFRTVEGNTNDDGSAEGYEVCARFRAYRKSGRPAYDFAII